MSSSYLFYYVMNYPLPLPGEREFLKFDLKFLPDFVDTDFKDVDIEWGLLEELIEQIKKYQYLLQKIPFLRGAFVVNSISFRKVHSNSDIDLFLIVKKNRLWIARFFAWWIFRNIKITKKYKFKRFCLSFWVEEDKLNLKNIALTPIDIYLVYWIVHAVPIFSDGWDVNDFYVNNKWINEFLPLRQSRQTIDLKIPLLFKRNKSSFFILNGTIGDIINWLIYILWHKLMLIKAILRKEELGVGTIIEKGIVKIHKDIRRKIIKKIFG